MDDLMQMVRSVADTDKVDPVCSDGAFITLTPEELERFSQLVRKDYSFTHAQLWLKRFDDAIQAENEACAKLCDRLDLEGLSLGGEPAPAYASDCAKAIRERLQGIQSEHCDCPGFCTGACEANR